MKKIEATQARQQFSETVNRVAYGGDRIVVKRRGRALAAIVPIADIHLIEECEEERAAKAKAVKSRTRDSKKARAAKRRVA
jgi:prevent-host-death family protein